MVTRPAQRQRAFLNIELVIAMSVLVVVLLPLAYNFRYEARSLRTLYSDAVAMEILDGEMDVLAAGEWKNMPVGATRYEAHGNALRNLPPGKFLVTREERVVRLEWLPDRGRKMKREVKLP